MKTRWFQLQVNGVIAYFTETKSQLKGQMVLAHTSAVRRMDSAEGRFGFVVETPPAGVRGASAGCALCRVFCWLQQQQLHFVT